MYPRRRSASNVGAPARLDRRLVPASSVPTVPSAYSKPLIRGDFSPSIVGTLGHMPSVPTVPEGSPDQDSARRCCGRASPRRKDKDLAWINQVGIADLLPVRLVNDGVARAVAVGEAADAPEAVAAGDGGGRDLRHDHGGGGA